MTGRAIVGRSAKWAVAASGRLVYSTAVTAPIIITAEMGKTDQAWANGLRRAHFPVARNFVDAHITLFHHLPPSHLPEIKSRLAALVADYPAPVAHLTDVMLMGSAVALRIDSPELLSLREELADAFRGLLIPQDEASPKLHITVQNKGPSLRSRPADGADPVLAAQKRLGATRPEVLERV